MCKCRICDKELKENWYRLDSDTFLDSRDFCSLDCLKINIEKSEGSL